MDQNTPFLGPLKYTKLGILVSKYSIWQHCFAHIAPNIDPTLGLTFASFAIFLEIDYPG
jgi:hypothetical protein